MIAEVSVWDDDPQHDDQIGQGKIDIYAECNDTECDKVVTVPIKTSDGDDNGTVDIRVKFSFEAWVA